MQKNRLAAVIALAIGLTGAVAAAGCQPRSSGSSDGAAPGSATPPGFGLLEVRVTDAPFPTNCFSEATLTIERFEIQPADHLGDVGFVPVTRTATFNLMDLTGGKTETIAQLTMPTGGYDRLRFNITAAVLSWHDGTQRNFVIPPDIRPIVRTGSIRIEPGLTTIVTLDFDLAQSFRQTGEHTTDCTALKADEKMTFAPVVRLVTASQRIVNGVVVDGQSGFGFPGVTVTGKSLRGTPRTTITGDGSGGEPVGFYLIYLEAAENTLFFEYPGRVTKTATVTVAPGAPYEQVNVTIR